MSQVKISELPDATALTGTEVVPVVQSGVTKKTTVAAFAGPTVGTIEFFLLACSDEVTPIVAIPMAVTFRMPYAFTVSSVKASLITAQDSGLVVTVDINESGVSILGTKITIDNGSTTSVTATTQPVLSDASLASDAEITIDIDQVGDGTAIGLKVTMIGQGTV